MIRAIVWMCMVMMGMDGLLQGQTAAPSQVSFKFERPVPGVAVPRYSIEIHGDGTGTYQAEVTAEGREPQPVERTLRFAPATVRSVTDGVRVMRASKAGCDAHIKNIADTGAKTIAFRDGDGEGACTFNYSENKGVMQLTELFQGVELTLEAGRALDFKHRFDRLGLDAEMITLAANVDSGKAVALETIAPTLRSIAADTELIERVRLRAAKLVQRADAR